MSQLLEIFLGVMTALGGFVDIGELVFTAQAGAKFGYALLWSIALGTIGIIVYSEMCGRIAAVVHEPVFTIIKQRLSRRLALVTFVSSSLVNVMTCVAEVGGIALLLRLAAGSESWIWAFATAAFLIAVIWLLPFKWLERVFGVAGLTMLVFVVAAWSLHPDWSAAANALLPGVPSLVSTDQAWLYAYFAVGIFSSLLMPYEVYFYAAGGIEEGWKPKDLPANKAITTVGFALGAIVAMAILVCAAQVLKPLGIEPDLAGTPALMLSAPLGRLGVELALAGMIAAVAGAAVETALAGAYNVAHWFNLPWGRRKPAHTTPAFTACWVAILVLAGLVNLTGIDPLMLVELSVMFAVLCLPLTYLPILLAARDRKLLGKHVNSRIIDCVGWLYLSLITVAALAAPVLLVVTRMGAYG
jgi:manganese transport protein